jgi:hypothetical protein
MSMSCNHYRKAYRKISRRNWKKIIIKRNSVCRLGAYCIYDLIYMSTYFRLCEGLLLR